MTGRTPDEAALFPDEDPQPVPAVAAAAESLMQGFRSGKKEAASQLVEKFYPELRRIAGARMAGERANHTWQPTVLVNELYLELTRIKALPLSTEGEEQQNAEFLRFAAFLMKRLLIHHARPLHRRAKKVDVNEALNLPSSGEASLREIESLLDRLGAIDPVLRTVVEMKVFEGMNREEMAERLGCSVRTVARHWEFAQHWLRSAMATDSGA